MSVILPVDPDAYEVAELGDRFGANFANLADFGASSVPLLGHEFGSHSVPALGVDFTPGADASAASIAARNRQVPAWRTGTTTVVPPRPWPTPPEPAPTPPPSDSTALLRKVSDWLAGSTAGMPLLPLRPASPPPAEQTPAPPVDPSEPHLRLIKGEGRGGGIGRKWWGHALTPNGGQIRSRIDVGVVTPEQNGREQELCALVADYRLAGKKLLEALITAEADGSIDRGVLDQLWRSLDRPRTPSE